MGILAVTAAPKLLSFEDDAKTGALNGLKGSVMSASDIGHAGWLLDKDKYKANFSDSGYPKGTHIQSLIEYDDNVFTMNKEEELLAEFRYGDDSTKCVKYSMADTDSTPTITVEACSS